MAARYEAPGGLGVDCQGLGEDYGHGLTHRRETGIRHCSWEWVERVDFLNGMMWTFMIFWMMLRWFWMMLGDEASVGRTTGWNAFFVVWHVLSIHQKGYDDPHWQLTDFFWGKHQRVFWKGLSDVGWGVGGCLGDLELDLWKWKPWRHWTFRR